MTNIFATALMPDTASDDVVALRDLKHKEIVVTVGWHRHRWSRYYTSVRGLSQYRKCKKCGKIRASLI